MDAFEAFQQGDALGVGCLVGVEGSDGVERFGAGAFPLGNVGIVGVFGIDQRHSGVAGQPQDFHFHSVGNADGSASVDDVDNAAALGDRR